jgi:nitrile hydratase accessory protein
MSLIESLPTHGVEAPPRANGELIFRAPWESRAFAMAASLVDQGKFSWSQFQQALIVSIGAWEAEEHSNDDYEYYVCWLNALESLVDVHQLVSRDELDERTATYVARPHGYDHDHGDHDHDHGEHGDHHDDHGDHHDHDHDHDDHDDHNH